MQPSSMFPIGLIAMIVGMSAYCLVLVADSEAVTGRSPRLPELGIRISIADILSQSVLARF
jgi:hypothetical protein